MTPPYNAIMGNRHGGITMQYCEKNTDKWGKVLWVTTDCAEVGIALEFGIRVVHMSCPGMENLFYEQDPDLSDGNATPQGWKLYGGHRIWLAPEGDSSYYPDNEPVRYTVDGDSVLVEQRTDPWTGMKKLLKLNFRESSISLENIFINDTDKVVEGGSWSINTLDGGGVARIDFAGTDAGDYTPRRVVSLWADTSLHDPRLKFEKHSLTATHMPLTDYFKLGLYCDPGKAVFENKGQRFTLTFSACGIENHPDNGCNFELYMAKELMELEVLGIKRTLQPGEAASHSETWVLEKI